MSMCVHYTEMWLPVGWLFASVNMVNRSKVRCKLSTCSSGLDAWVHPCEWWCSSVQGCANWMHLAVHRSANSPQLTGNWLKAI